MFTVVTVIHIVACLSLVGVVLLQQGKGADMGAVFGGSSSTIFGSSGAGNFLTRLTTGIAVVFMLTSLTLTYTSARKVTSTVFDEAPLPEPPPLAEPAAPGAEPQAAAPAGEAVPLQVEVAPQEGAPAPEVKVEAGTTAPEAAVEKAVGVEAGEAGEVPVNPLPPAVP